MLRHEPPDQRNRWNRPLDTVDTHSTLSNEMLYELQIKSNKDKMTTMKKVGVKQQARCQRES